MMFFRKPQPTFHPVYTMAVCALAVIGAAGVAMAVKNRMGCKIRKTAADAMKMAMIPVLSDVVFLGEGAEPVYYVQGAFKIRALEKRGPASAVLFGEAGVFIEFPGKDSLGQGTIGNDADLVLDAVIHFL